MYDYLIVGAGLFGATFTNEAVKCGKKCLVIDKRNHIGGNIFTENRNGINIHKYGAHIFHTSDIEVWSYINTFAKFNGFVNSPIADFNGERFNLPFNMNTFHQMWGIDTAEEAQEIISSQTAKLNITSPKNLEEQALMLVGRDVYEKLIKGYTEKQWGRKCTELPAFIIRRVPLRFTYDNNYFNDLYQGIPIGGYTQIVEKMLEDADVRLNTDFNSVIIKNPNIAKKVIYSGTIDGFYGYKLGRLKYRSLRFETEQLNVPDYQGNAVINYTSDKVPYTRIIEHKYFEDILADKTIITREFPQEWDENSEPYYPVNDEVNNDLYEKYKVLSEKENNVYFGGRLGKYRYFDMDKTIREALDLSRRIL